MNKIIIAEDGWVSVEIHVKDGLPDYIGLGDIGVDVEIEDKRKEANNSEV